LELEAIVTVTNDVLQACRAAAAAQLGVDLPDEIIADGKLPRCEVGPATRACGAGTAHAVAPCEGLT
jgi:hypothetical protein